MITRSETLKILGINLSKNLKWDNHINGIIKGCKFHLRAFRRSIKYIDINERKLLYNSCLASRLSYGDIIWKETTQTLNQRLQVIQNNAARAILSKKPRDNAKPLLKELKWLSLHNKRRLHGDVMLHKIIKGKAPKSLQNMLKEYKITRQNDTRMGRGNGYCIPAHRTNMMGDSFFISTLKSWNKLPAEIKDTRESINFKSKVNALYLTLP